MSKVELGNKHLCASCNTKFYDLQKEVPVCPKCNVEIVIKVKPRLGRPPLNKKPVVEPPKVKDENDDDELDSELENLVSIEDLDKDLIADNDGINIDDDEEEENSDNLLGIADLDAHSKNEETDH